MISLVFYKSRYGNSVLVIYMILSYYYFDLPVFSADFETIKPIIENIV